jgi:hypothetical protein
MVLAIGIGGDELPRLLDMVAATSNESGVVPIVVTDHADLAAFRDRGLIVEYIPDEAQQKAQAADLEWQVYILHRLALLRRKWQPGNTIAFGANSGNLLRRWQASPIWEARPSTEHFTRPKRTDLSASGRKGHAPVGDGRTASPER